jgi:hypothetical protein
MSEKRVKVPGDLRLTESLVIIQQGLEVAANQSSQPYNSPFGNKYFGKSIIALDKTIYSRNNYVSFLNLAAKDCCFLELIRSDEIVSWRGKRFCRQMRLVITMSDLKKTVEISYFHETIIISSRRRRKKKNNHKISSTSQNVSETTSRAIPS